MSSVAFDRSLGGRETLVLAFGAMLGWSWATLAGRWVGLGALLAIVARAQR